MQLKRLNEKLIILGRGLISKIKYGFSYPYHPYDFLSTRQYKKDEIKLKIQKLLSKKLC
jgi:hypothetical protein